MFYAGLWKNKEFQGFISADRKAEMLLKLEDYKSEGYALVGFPFYISKGQGIIHD